MDNKLLLVKSVTLLFWESQLENNGNSSNELVKNIVKDIKLPANLVESDRNRDILAALRATALWMADQPASHKYDRNALLQRLHINLAEDNGLYQSITEFINKELTEEEVISTTAIYRNELYAFSNQAKITDIIQKAAAKIKFEPESVDWNTFISEMQDDLDGYGAKASTAIDDNFVASVDLGDAEALEETFKQAQEEMSVEGIMSTGYQSINRMCGWMGGLRRGDQICLGALQHNYKSGFTLDLFRQIAVHNKPYLLDPAKKPALIFLSLENSVNDNVINLYCKMKEMETKQPVNIKEIPFKEAAEYVSKKLSEQGYHVKMLRYNPSEFTFRDMYDLINKLELEGYEIHALFIDYLNMASKVGCSGSTESAQIRDLFRRLRNFCGPKKITTFTPHQLSTDASMLLRQGSEYFVKEIANKNYWADSKQIAQEIDLELYIHIEKVQGVSYLTVQRGKHRQGGPVTKEEDLYTVLKFQEVGGIWDDINGEDLSQRRVGPANNSAAGNSTWFD